jgi:hypothetical protein
LLDPSVDRRNESVECHGQLIACLHAGDGAGADAAMRAHIGVTARAVDAVLEAETAPRDTPANAASSASSGSPAIAVIPAIPRAARTTPTLAPAARRTVKAKVKKTKTKAGPQTAP